MMQAPGGVVVLRYEIYSAPFLERKRADLDLGCVSYRHSDIDNPTFYVGLAPTAV